MTSNPTPATNNETERMEETMTTQSPQRSDTIIDPELEQAAKEYVKQLQAFLIHAALFGICIVVIFVVNLLTNISAGTTGQWSSWWSIWAFLGWGPGVAVHGLVLRLNKPSATPSSWEQRQIDKVLNQ